MSFIKAKDLDNIKSFNGDPGDPTYWTVNDILYMTYNYNACIPVFYKILKKVGKATFELVKLEKKVVNGSYNSPAGYEVIPTNETADTAVKRVRISKGRVSIDKERLYLWDGNPVHGYSD